MRTHLAALAVLSIGAVTAVPAKQQPGGIKAFTGMRLFDGTDRAPIGGATIVVRNGRIAAAGPAASVTIPAGAERVSLAGKYVIPGMINAHGHVNNADRDLKTYAAYGVTTVFSLGDDQPPSFAARDAQATASLTRARIFVSGPVLNPRTPEEARDLVSTNAASKADYVKIRVDDNLGTTPKMAPEIYRAVIAEAHRQGKRVAVHLFYLAPMRRPRWPPAPTSLRTACATPRSTRSSSPRSRRAASASAPR